MKGTKSIEETSKIGGWSAMQSMAEKMIEVTGLATPFIKLAEVLEKMTSAETADSVALIYGELFTEENMGQSREQIKMFGDAVHFVVKGMIDARNVWNDWMDSLDRFDKETMPKLRTAFDDWLIEVDELGKNTGTAIFTAIANGVTDAINNWTWNLNFGGGGGGGGGGGESPWWEDILGGIG